MIVEDPRTSRIRSAEGMTITRSFRQHARFLAVGRSHRPPDATDALTFVVISVCRDLVAGVNGVGDESRGAVAHDDSHAANVVAAGRHDGNLLSSIIFGAAGRVRSAGHEKTTGKCAERMAPPGARERKCHEWTIAAVAERALTERRRAG